MQTANPSYGGGIVAGCSNRVWWGSINFLLVSLPSFSASLFFGLSSFPVLFSAQRPRELQEAARGASRQLPGELSAQLSRSSPHSCSEAPRTAVRELPQTAVWKLSQRAAWELSQTAVWKLSETAVWEVSQTAAGELSQTAVWELCEQQLTDTKTKTQTQKHSL